MKIEVGYEALVAAVSTVSTALSGKSSEADSIIFLVDKGILTLAGWSALLHLRVSVPEAVVELEESEESPKFEVKISQIQTYLDTFKNLYRTKAEKVVFTQQDRRIKMSVHEVPLEEDDESYDLISPFFLDKASVRAGNLKVLEMPFASENVEIASTDSLSLFLSTLMPNMVDEANEGLSAKMYFAPDWIFVLSQTHSCFMINTLPEVFKDVTLGYSSVNFLKKVVQMSNDDIEVARGDYLEVRSGNIEAFFRYQKVSIRYSQRLNNRTKAQGVKLDRGYLTDVLKRLEVSGGPGGLAEVEITEEALLVRNDNFEQRLPIEAIKGDIVGWTFKLPVKVFGKALLGTLRDFESDTFLYLTDSNLVYSLFLQDSTDAWVSAMQVRKGESKSASSVKKKRGFVPGKSKKAVNPGDFESDKISSKEEVTENLEKLAEKSAANEEEERVLRETSQEVRNNLKKDLAEGADGGKVELEEVTFDEDGNEIDMSPVLDFDTAEVGL